MGPWDKSKTKWVLLLALACLLLLLRLCLAAIVKLEINDRLGRMSLYSGRIGGVGLSLWRGAYQLEDIKIVKRGSVAPVPFFTAPLIDVGLQWMALFHGRIVASIAIHEGQLNFVNGPDNSKSQGGLGEDWLNLVESLAPLKINQFRIQQSQIHFRDPYGKPPVDLRLQDLNLLAENLSSRREGPAAVLGSMTATARVMDDALLVVRARFDPSAQAPTFDYGATLTGLKLTELNPFLLRYAGIDVQAGTLDVYSEAAAADGKFKSYIKPMLRDLKVMKPHEAFDPVKVIKKALVATLNWIFKNDRDHKVATKLEFAGNFNDPKTSLWSAVFYLFENGFIRALPPGLEGKIKVEELQKKFAPVVSGPSHK